MENLINYSIKKLSDAEVIVRYRRINWTVIEKTINQEFSLFVAICRKSNFPYIFKIANYREHNNEHSIEIRCIKHPKTNLVKINSTDGENPHIFEKGGNLVASQGHQGLVLFMFKPFKTEKVDLNFKEILISQLIDPRKIDVKFLNNILKKYLLLIRYTSLNGDQTFSLIERLKISLILIMDLRHKHNLMRSVISMQNEWSKLIVGALIGALITWWLS